MSRFSSVRLLLLPHRCWSAVRGVGRHRPVPGARQTRSARDPHGDDGEAECRRHSVSFWRHFHSLLSVAIRSSITLFVDGKLDRDNFYRWRGRVARKSRVVRGTFPL